MQYYPDDNNNTNDRPIPFAVHAAAYALPDICQAPTVDLVLSGAQHAQDLHEDPAVVLDLVLEDMRHLQRLCQSRRAQLVDMLEELSADAGADGWSHGEVCAIICAQIVWLDTLMGAAAGGDL